MSAAIAASFSSSNITALILADAAPSSTDSGPPASDATGGSNNDDRGAATNVQLSDSVKTTLARAKADQALADELQSLVEAQRTGGTGNLSPAGNSSKTDSDIDQAFEQLSGENAQVADSSQFTPVQVHSFSTGLEADGFTVAAIANANTGSSSIEIVGPNGFSFYDNHFGWSDEATGGLTGGPGRSDQEYQSGNVEYITLSQSEASATSTTTSSNAGITSASTVAAQSTSVTIAIDFTTGAIGLTQTQASFASAAQQSSQPTRSLSILARAGQPAFAPLWQEMPRQR